MREIMLHKQPPEICRPRKSDLIAQVPYTYKSLREHVAEVHPEMLAPFERGWNMLHHTVQHQWLAMGGQRVFSVTYWTSWAVIVAEREEIFRSHSPIWNVQERLANIIARKMAHPGEIYKLPALPRIEAASYKFDNDVEVTGMIADSAAWEIINRTLPLLLEQLTDEIEEEGSAALRRMYPLASGSLK